MLSRPLLALAGALALVVGTASAAPIATGEMLANSCAGCHGTNGRISNSAFMPLAGMPQEQFVRTMTDFREGRRSSTLMGHVTKGYSDEELKAMAAFFASVKP